MTKEGKVYRFGGWPRSRHKDQACLVRGTNLPWKEKQKLPFGNCKGEAHAAFGRAAAFRYSNILQEIDTNRVDSPMAASV